jgi:hypothetical protein
MPRLLGDIVAAIKTIGTYHPAGNQQNQAATTAALGWQMAQLYGPLAEDTRTDNAGDHLPAISEYVGSARGLLGIDEVKTLLPRAGLAYLDSSSLNEWAAKDETGRRQAVMALHYQILDSLACSNDPAQSASYELGAALSDTCWLPDTDRHLSEPAGRMQIFFDQFSRDRLATLQGWLGSMNPLAPQAVPAITRSIQNWADWTDTNRSSLQKNWARHEAAVVAALRNQAKAWHS